MQSKRRKFLKVLIEIRGNIRGKTLQMNEEKYNNIDKETA